jgi:hypothetical protein
MDPGGEVLRITYYLLGIFGVLISLIYGGQHLSPQKRLLSEVTESGQNTFQSLSKGIVTTIFNINY